MLHVNTPTCPVASSNRISLINNIKTPLIAKLDSGASQHYITKKHIDILQNKIPLQNGPIAMLPNKTVIKADTQGLLPLHNSLTTVGQKALSFPNLTNESLLSVGQLCNDNCEVKFDKNTVTVLKNEKVILKGKRNIRDNLYDINLLQNQVTKPVQNKINYIIRRDKTSSDLAQYLFAAAFSPSLSTFTRAIRNGNFVTWPGIQKLNFKLVM